MLIIASASGTRRTAANPKPYPDASQKEAVGLANDESHARVMDARGGLIFLERVIGSPTRAFSI
jgi:hypothetical protein